MKQLRCSPSDVREEPASHLPVVVERDPLGDLVDLTLMLAPGGILAHLLGPLLREHLGLVLVRLLNAQLQGLDVDPWSYLAEPLAGQLHA